MTSTGIDTDVAFICVQTPNNLSRPTLWILTFLESAINRD